MRDEEKSKDQLNRELAELRERVGESGFLQATSGQSNCIREQPGLPEAFQELQAIYDGMVDGVLIAEIESTRFLRANAAISRLLGYTPDEFLRMSIGDIHPQETLPTILKHYRDLAAQRMKKAIEVPCLRKDGNVFFADITANQLVYRGQPCLMGFFRDVTLRKRAQEALAYERFLLLTLLENIPDYIYFKDAESRFIRISRELARSYGLGDPEDAVGKTDFDFFDSDRADRALKDEQQVMRTGQPVVDKEEKQTWPDGRTTWVSTTKVPLRNAEGETVGTFGISRDITRRKRAEEAMARTKAELERSNAELGEFASTVSHDLHEPLRAVSGFLTLLKRRYQGKLDATADEFVDFAVQGANRMSKMIEDLLAISRVQSRGRPFVSTNCETVLEQAQANLHMAIQESGAVITRDSLPSLSADRAQMVQLFQNLIGNAIKFRRDDPPRIHVSARVEDGGYVFSIQDNGIGLEPRHADRIFQVFQRLHASRYPGTGIGLALCKRVVERHGGKIWVESQPGQGSTFHFVLPAKPEASGRGKGNS
jgi:PAS domain S-box-containing protein